MLISTIVAAVLLFVLAFVVLADACRPMLLLNLGDRQAAPREPERRGSGSAASPPPFELHLTAEDRDGFFSMWRSVRDEFEVNPGATILHADLLISDLIEDSCGSVALDEWDEVVSREDRLGRVYRTAHEIALRSRDGRAKLHELKRAIGLYTALFEDLLGRSEISERPH